MITASLDYETFYSKDYSIRDLGNYGYTRHPDFDPYMLTAATDTGDTWAGNPLDFNYEDAHGQIWVMANAGFDLTVTERIYELHPDIFQAKPSVVYDVLDLARYLGHPGNLAGAAKAMLGKTLDKGTRDKAKGKHWHEMSAEFQQQLREYAIRDAQVTLEIWLQYGHLWPEHERRLSQLTRDMCAMGVPVDLLGIKKDIRNLETLLWKTRTMIPWAEDPEAPALSKKAMAIECRKAKIDPPASMAKDSEIFDAWLKQHGEKFQWARAMGSYRSINGQLKKLKAMLARSKPTGWMPYGLKYAGAHTLRDSGDAGVNVQNFAKEVMFEKEMRDMLNKQDAPENEIYGLDIRGKIVAPEGKMLAVVDLVAIEPCCSATLSEDWGLVEKLVAGMDVYEAWAREHHGYTDPRPLKEVDPALRQMCKVEVLALGYGAGVTKAIIIAKTQLGIELSQSEAEVMVLGFRATKFMPDLWNKLESTMRDSAPGDFNLQLPSGRSMVYRDVRSFGSLSAVIVKGGTPMRLKFWGGSLTENLVQASARDIFMDRVLALDDAGLPPVLRVHDEAVCVLDEKDAEDGLQTMIETMSKAPSWWPEVPVRAAGHLCKRYVKS